MYPKKMYFCYALYFPKIFSYVFYMKQNTNLITIVGVALTLPNINYSIHHYEDTCMYENTENLFKICSKSVKIIYIL